MRSWNIVAAVALAVAIIVSGVTAQRLSPSDSADEGFVDRIMSFDKNNDGKVAPDEIPKAMRRIITRVDTNEDGVIERSELGQMREGTRSWNPPAAKEDVGAETATHVEIEPLPIEFGELTALRLRSDGNLLAADAEEGLLKVVSQSGELLSQIDPGFHPEVIDTVPRGAVYCGGDGFVAQLTADGELLKKVELPGPSESDAPARRAPPRPPGISGLAVADDAVYVTFGSGWSVSSKAKLYRFTLDLEDPQLLAEGLRVCCQHCDIAFRDGLLYLSENSAYRILIYDCEGQVVNKWGSKSRDDLTLFGGCCNPMNITFGADGALYTAESGMGRVKRYSPDGEFLGLVGYLDVERFVRGGALSAACCHIPFAVTPDGERVYVTDVKTNTIRVLQRIPR